MKLRCEQVTPGPGPGEVIVDIKTVSGIEDVIVDQSFVKDRLLNVWEIGGRDEKVLVELPRETSSGSWRVWVTRDTIAA